MVSEVLNISILPNESTTALPKLTIAPTEKAPTTAVPIVFNLLSSTDTVDSAFLALSLNWSSIVNTNFTSSAAILMLPHS